MDEKHDKLTARQRSGFVVVRIVLGTLLIVAGSLKLFDPTPTSSASPLWFLNSPSWHMALIELEILIGIWLLTGALPRLLWFVALAQFSLMAVMSLYLGIERHSSCGCFGTKLTISPWYAMVLDLLGVGSLIYWRPLQLLTASEYLPTFLFRTLQTLMGAAAILVCVFGILTLKYGSPSGAISRLLTPA